MDRVALLFPRDDFYAKKQKKKKKRERKREREGIRENHSVLYLELMSTRGADLGPSSNHHQLGVL